MVLERHTLKGPSVPHKLPRRNLVIMAIQKFTLTPKSVLNITLKKYNQDKYKRKYEMKA